MNRPPHLFKDSNHPLAGRITAGVRTTLLPERRPRVSMQLPEFMTPSIEDYARQMFSENDPVGTRIYYSEIGNFNTVDEMGRAISFIGGLFKTNERDIKRFLQYFVDQGNIKYLELGAEDNARKELPVPEEHERSEGSASGFDASNEQNQQESEQRLSSTPEPAGSGSGGESRQANTDQPSDRTTISSSSGNGNDQQEQGREEPSGESSQEDTVSDSLSPLERLRQKAGQG